MGLIARHALRALPRRLSQRAMTGSYRTRPKSGSKKSRGTVAMRGEVGTRARSKSCPGLSFCLARQLHGSAEAGAMELVLAEAGWDA